MKIRKDNKKVIDLMNIETTATRTFQQCQLCFNETVKARNMYFVKVTELEARNFYGEGKEIYTSTLPPRDGTWRFCIMSKKESMLNFFQIVTFSKFFEHAQQVAGFGPFRMHFWVRTK